MIYFLAIATAAVFIFALDPLIHYIILKNMEEAEKELDELLKQSSTQKEVLHDPR